MNICSLPHLVLCVETVTCETSKTTHQSTTLATRCGFWSVSHCIAFRPAATKQSWCECGGLQDLGCECLPHADTWRCWSESVPDCWVIWSATAWHWQGDWPSSTDACVRADGRHFEHFALILSSFSYYCKCFFTFVWRDCCLHVWWYTESCKKRCQFYKV